MMVCLNEFGLASLNALYRAKLELVGVKSFSANITNCSEMFTLSPICGSKI